MAAHHDANELAARIDALALDLRLSPAVPTAQLADVLLDARLVSAACGPIGTAAMRCVDAALGASITGRGLVPSAEALDVLVEVGAALRVAAVASELAAGANANA